MGRLRVFPDEDLRQTLPSSNVGAAGHRGHVPAGVRDRSISSLSRRGEVLASPAPEDDRLPFHGKRGANMAEAAPTMETITIPGYRIESLLGQGGMANVFLAIQESFQRRVALKVMSPLLNSDPSFAARFRREARIVAQLSHASIVPVFDVGEHRGHHYLSMEYLPGGDLKQRVLRGGGDVNLAVNVCTALSAALELAHRKGFVHRDIKPANILFRADGTPVLTDFGIARVFDNGRSMTVAGMLVGTPSYMSPEQVKGLELDGRSDLYSIGIVFFETLTGAVPFDADSTLSTALKHVSDPLPPLPQKYSAFQEFLDCLTAKDRDERFASGAEVIRALRVIGTGRVARNPMPMRVRSSSDPHTAAAKSEMDAPGATSPTVQSNASQPTLARSQVAGDSPTSRMSFPGRTDVADGQGGSIGFSSAPADTTSSEGVAATRVGSAASRSDLASARKGGPASSPDVMAARNDLPAGLLNPNTARARRRASAWRALAKPARARQLLLVVAVVAALVIGGTLFKARSPDKGAGLSKSNGPAVALPREASATSESGSSQVPGPGTEAAGPGNEQVIEQVGRLAAPAATSEAASSAATAEPGSAASQTSPSAPGAQLPSSSSALAKPGDAAASVRNQASPRDKRPTEKQRQRKEEEARLIERQVAQLRATQLQAQEAHIQELLSRAKLEYDAGALWQPAGASAADRYREILQLQPGRAEAVAGALRIANVLASEAESSEAAGDIYTSKLLVEQVQMLQPDHQKLGELRARLEQLVASPVSANLRDRARLERAAKYIARAEEALGHQPIDYRAATDAVKQYDNALSAAGSAPGMPSLQERLIAACAAAVRTELNNNDPKRALKLIKLAHKHNWASEDLDQLEASMQSKGMPTAQIKEVGAQ
jgi:serine/threonine-protein kinase PpkA